MEVREEELKSFFECLPGSGRDYTGRVTVQCSDLRDPLIMANLLASDGAEEFASVIFDSCEQAFADDRVAEVCRAYLDRRYGPMNRKGRVKC